MKTYETTRRSFDSYPKLFSELADKSITILDSIFHDKLLIGTNGNGLYIYDLSKLDTSSSSA
jgi:hypothetical protein